MGAAAWDLRLARAVPFALVCTLIAAAGHALVGGGNVPPAALATGFAAVLVLAVALGGRERSLPAIAGALGAGQLGLHCLFHGFHGFAASGMPGMPGMQHGATTVRGVAGRLICNEAHPGTLDGLPGGPSAEQLVSSAGLDPHAFAAAPWWQGGVLGMTPSMLAGHLAAALVAGWWLRRGEAALWRLVRVAASAAREHWAAPLRSALALAVALLRGLFGAAGPARRFGARGGESPLPGGAVLRHSVVRRGPPRGVFAY
ncbi:hypothetical protein VM98_19950 [Streptomyces rubellomurinus subsp. indigoferus]|uniref:Integral membrane protein n=1 Tax=Streptomyces rubellomurinus (strain ATCC 31215) TaxID=359131 RepID=A0A0F2T5R7_STRR3|nr:hypothetical protein VM98_19950 [Streptomyces rubellomurinus subsp. indigoferus]KJS58554.1 hypothetical protein VM95_32725 [Streptomyces rubellomurinus]